MVLMLAIMAAERNQNRHRQAKCRSRFGDWTRRRKHAVQPERLESRSFGMSRARAADEGSDAARDKKKLGCDGESEPAARHCPASKATASQPVIMPSMLCLFCRPHAHKLQLQSPVLDGTHRQG